MRAQLIRAAVVAVCCVGGLAILCRQAMAADLADAKYLQKRGPSLRRAHATNTVGNPPSGYGTVITWDRADGEMIVVAYLNAADNLGPAILNLKKGDRVQLLSVDGMASFSDSSGKLVESIVAVATKAADAGAAALGAPQAAPIIEAGGQFASNQFGKASKGDLRDGYGKDPGGTMRRQEGGVLVCMPEAGGLFYSGGFFHRDRWVQGDDGGDRTDNRLPKHMRGTGAFFPVRGNKSQDVRIAKADGILHLVPWDFDFGDNAGFYRVILRITRGDKLRAPVAVAAHPTAKPAQPQAAGTANRLQPTLLRPR